MNIKNGIVVHGTKLRSGQPQERPLCFQYTRSSTPGINHTCERDVAAAARERDTYTKFSIKFSTKFST